MTEVISVRFRGGCKNYFFDPKGHTVKMGDQVIVETAQGPEFGTCTQGNHEVADEAIVQPLCAMLRLATDADRRTVDYNRKKESEAFDICEKKIADHGLEMKLVNVSASFDGSKIIFFFTADGRVDFIFPADYRADTELDRTVRDILRKMTIADRLANTNTRQLRSIGKSELPDQVGLF